MSIGDRLGALDDRALDHLNATRVGRRVRAWRARPTVRDLLSEPAHVSEVWRDHDRRDNDETRLDANERVNHAGVTILEAFTPSTISALRRSLRTLGKDDRGREKNLDFLSRARTHAGAWSSLGHVRPTGSFVFGDGKTDPTLPAGVQAVWLGAHYVLPSLAIVSATFTFGEDASELGGLLRADYTTSAYDRRIQVAGRLRWFQRRVPWSRPRAGTGYTIRTARDAKRLAVDSFMDKREAECRRWFNVNFPGRFSLADPNRQPSARVVLTDSSVPLSSKVPSLEVVDLGDNIDAWRATETKGWRVTFRRSNNDRVFRALYAARRGDLKRIRDNGTGEEAVSNWSITQQFAGEQSFLLARWAIACLLTLYEEGLADFRDNLAPRRWTGHARPIREAKALDAYLTGDGMDAATICHDIRTDFENVKWFRRGVPEYEEDITWRPHGRTKGAPLQLVEELHRGLIARSERLQVSFATTTANVRASADLRHAIANTRLQRVILSVTLIAALVTAAGLLLSS